MTIRLFFVITSMLITHTGVTQKQSIVKEDLNPRWQVAAGDQYQKFVDQQATTIYFSINPALYSNDNLVLEAEHPFSVLLNNTLLADRVQQLTISIDSLSTRYGTSGFFIAIHSTKPITTIGLSTKITSPVLFSVGKADENYLRADNRFRDFAITAILVLVIFLVSIIRLNPGLSVDFFSIQKIFSFRENEDDHYYYRVSSSTILFYVFTSLLIGLYIVMVTWFTDTHKSWSSTLNTSYWIMMFTWLKVSLYTLLFLFTKICIIYLVSTLFGIRAVAGYHFFNFVRVLLIAISVLTVVLVVYYIPHGQRVGFYNFLYAIIPWILGAWIVLGFFKLAARVHHSAFHLFSYICATELIPFLLILKVLNT